MDSIRTTVTRSAQLNSTQQSGIDRARSELDARDEVQQP